MSVLFSRSGAHLYAALTTGSPVYRAFFVLPADTDADMLDGETLWNSGGICVFVDSGISFDEDTLMRETWRLAHGSARIIWFDRLTGGAHAVYLALDSAAQTERLTAIPYGGVHVLIQKSRLVEMDDAGFVIRLDPDAPFQAVNNGGTRETLNQDIRIPLGGATTGILDVSIPLTHPTDFGIVMRYLYQVGWGAVMQYPLFEVVRDGVRAGEIVALPGGGWQFALEFTKPAGQTDYAYFPTCFRTIHGHKIWLQPTRDSRLMPTVFGSTFYYVPDGAFRVMVAHKDGLRVEADDRLLCGVGGTEYVTLRAAEQGDSHHNLLIFKAGQDASIDADGNLTPDFTTAWCSVGHEDPAQAVWYYAQPQQAPLYFGTTDAMEYLEVPAARLGGDMAFPMVPHSGITWWELARSHQFESQVVYPLRRDAIYTWAKTHPDTQGNPAATGATVTGTTPQGLVESFDDDYLDIEQVILATYPGGETSLIDIPAFSPIKQALNSQQLFMVISDRETLRASFSGANSHVMITDWKFILGSDNWRADTVLIFKYQDKPLLDLIETPDLWSLAREFNPDIAATQKLLREILNHALEVVPLDETQESDPTEVEKYEHLAGVIRNENWTGVLAFNIPITPEAFPEALKCLCGGMSSVPVAQYVALEATPTAADLRPGSAGNMTSTYALIDYSGDRPNRAYLEAEHTFRVLSLTVIFRNSSKYRFACEVAVKTETLFGDAVWLEEGRPPYNFNEIFLTGREEEHHHTTVYSFASTRSNRFSVLSESPPTVVDVERAIYRSEPINGQPHASFILQGRLNLASDDDFDILSFGSEDGKPSSTHGLSFSEMRISFPCTNPGANNPTGFFNIAHMSFDMSRSTARAQSLFAKYPLKLTGITGMQSGTVPDGYLHVQTPLHGERPSGEWYGLMYDLEIGSAGALTGDTGLVVGLIAAWQPGSRAVFVGLRLPWSTGQSEMTIQDVVKIVFERIVFDVSVDGRGASYTLLLKDIKLKVLRLSIPYNGHTQIIIFGDPEASASDKTLGWYAAYAGA